MFYDYYFVVGYAYEHSIELDDATPALCAFRAKFFEKDHHLKNLVVAGRPRLSDSTVDPNRLVFSLSDANSDLEEDREDTNEIGIHYANFFDSPYLEGGGFRTVRGTGNGRNMLSVPIPPPGPDHLVVLSGFEFRGKPETDHHIREIQIRYIPSTNSFRVRYRDNSPDDDSYTVDIHYLLLRKELDYEANFVLKDAHTQSINFTKEATVIKEVPGRGLLSGFSFRFKDDDHHIRCMEVNVKERDEIFVCFSDDEEDNPVEAIIDYVILDTSA